MSDIPGRGVHVDEENIEEMERKVVPSKVKDADIDRMTVLFKIHKEHCCDDPDSFNGDFSALLNSKGVQTYQRKIKVTEQKSPVDLGWIESEGAKIGFLAIKHTKSDQTKLQEVRNKIASPVKKEGLPKEEKTEEAIYVYLKPDSDEPDFELQQGECMAGPPCEAKNWRLKSSKGTLNGAVAVFPG